MPISHAISIGEKFGDIKVVDGKRIDKAMAKGKGTKSQAIMYKTLHRNKESN